MAFYPQKGLQKGGKEAHWTAYSDLFMTLSLLFLFLYAVASLRGGVYSIQKSVEQQRLTQEVEDLKQQIEVFNTLKEDYLNRGATKQEKELYSDLMDQLNLLQDKAKDEKNQLRQQALENEKKEMALNKYQQMIRNLINTNLVAQNRIKRREDIIQEKEIIIADKYKEIKQLESDVATKQNKIQQSEQEIAHAKARLDKKIKELNYAYHQNKISKEKLEKEVQSVREQSKAAISDLKRSNEEISSGLADAKRKLGDSKNQLFAAQSKIAEGEAANEALLGKLQGIADQHRGEIEGLKRGFSEQMGKERAAFDKALGDERLSGAQRAAREAQFKEMAERKAKDLEGKIAGLASKVKDSEAELVKAKELLNARKQIAKRIAQNFKNAGVDAVVDPNTGEVTLSFGQYYFDTDKSTLKTEMKAQLDKMVPIYAQSLFEDQKVAHLISSVEIEGFASPTYQGKYIDPASLNPEDRSAVNYNLDLSFDRGKAVFNYIFDQNILKFKYQQKLRPLVKVTGRSFLAEEIKGRDIATSMPRSDFCKKYDCHKAQRVIIKFNLKD